MAAAAEGLGDTGYVDAALAADREAKLIAGGQLAQKHGRLDSGDADEVVDDALAVFRDGASAIEILLGDPAPCDRPVALQIRERGAEEFDLAERRGEQDVSRDLAGIGSLEREIVGRA